MTEQSTSSQIKANLTVTLAMVFFSLSLPLLEELAHRYSVMSLVSIRNIIAGTFLVLLGVAMERDQKLSSSGWRHVLFSGSTYYILSIICLFYAITFAGAFSAAIILSMVPVLSALLDVVGGYGRFGPRLVVSLILSLLGGVMASLDYQNGTMQLALSFGWGEALLLIGVLSWVLLSRYVNTHLTSEPQLKSIGLIMAVPGLLLVPFVAGLEYWQIEPTQLIREDGWGMPAFDIFLLLMLAMVASAGSMVLWFRGSSQLGTTIAGLQQNLVPFFVLLQVWWLGQYPHILQIMGGVLVVLGALVAQYRELRPRLVQNSS